MHQLPVLIWTEISFMIACFFGNFFFMFFLKVLMRKVLTRCTIIIVIWYGFRENENGKGTRFFHIIFAQTLTAHNICLTHITHSIYLYYTSLGYILSIKRKRKRSDSVLWQKPLHQQKCQKGKVTTQTTPQKSSIKQRLRTDLGRSVGVTKATQLKVEFVMQNMMPICLCSCIWKEGLKTATSRKLKKTNKTDYF